MDSTRLPAVDAAADPLDYQHHANMAADVQVPAEDLTKHHALPGYEAEHGVAETARMIRIHSGEQRSAKAL